AARPQKQCHANESASDFHPAPLWPWTIPRLDTAATPLYTKKGARGRNVFRRGGRERLRDIDYTRALHPLLDGIQGARGGAGRNQLSRRRHAHARVARQKAQAPQWGLAQAV